LISGDLPPPTLGEKIIEGKTKIVYAIEDSPCLVFIKSKDRITAGDGAKSHELAGKAAISTDTATKIFNLLSKSGIILHLLIC
jgi:phosphoribosylaminoimidazole carboxylase/phosphoribosylaminoimidazole-succinocarboxamide synthase